MELSKRAAGLALAALFVAVVMAVPTALAPDSAPQQLATRMTTTVEPSPVPRPRRSPQASRSRRIPPRRHSWHLHRVTAYCATGSRMFNGEWPYVGAAAGNRWPIGTKLLVPGWGVVVVKDHIGHGSDLDLFMSSCSAASAWGHHDLIVTEYHS